MASYCSQDCGVAYFKTRHWWCTKLPPVDGFALRTHKRDIPDICSPSCLCSPWHSWHTFYSWHILFSLKLPLYYKRFTKYCREHALHYISLVCILVCTPYSPQILPQKLWNYYCPLQMKKKISSILLLNYLNIFQFVKYLHISLFIDGFKGVYSTTIGYFLIRQTEFGGFAH